MRIGEKLTLRSGQALLAAGLITPAALPEVEATEARYAVAVSPAMRALIEAPDDPDRAAVHSRFSELVTAAHRKR